MSVYEEYKQAIIDSLGDANMPAFAPFDEALEKGLDINSYEHVSDRNRQDTLLSMIMEDYGYGADSAVYLPIIVGLFLDNGYDVHMNDGLHGTLCLEKLCYSYHCDPYYLLAAKKLLDAGADPNKSVYDDEDLSPLDIARRHDSENRGIIDDDLYKANYYYTLAEIFDYYNNGLDYWRPLHIESILGQTVRNLYVEKESENIKNYHGVMKPLSFRNNRAFLICDERVLDIDLALGIIVDKSMERIQQYDLRDYTDLLGSRKDKEIVELQHRYHIIENYSPHVTTELIVGLDNGESIVLSTDYAKGPYPEVWFATIDME